MRVHAQLAANLRMGIVAQRCLCGDRASEAAQVNFGRSGRSRTLSPREERVGREKERGESFWNYLLSPALSSLTGREGEDTAYDRQVNRFSAAERQLHNAGSDFAGGAVAA